MALPSFSVLPLLSLLGTLLNRSANCVAPLRPATVVVPHAIVAEEIGEHEPGMGGSLANAAVRDDVVAFLETLFLFVDGAQRSRVLEASIRIRGARPGNTARSLDVAAPQGSFLRVIGHVGALSGVFFGRTYVDKRLTRRRVLANLLEESANLFIRTFRRLVAAFRKARDLCIEGTPFLLPLDAPAVQKLRIGEAK